MTLSVAACVSATFPSLILARTINTFIDRFPFVPGWTLISRRRTSAGRGDSPGLELFKPPGQEPPLGGGGGQLERPLVCRPGLVVAAETPQQLTASGVEIEVAVQVEHVDCAQRRGGFARLG